MPPHSKFRANFCVLSLKQSFLMQFWAKKYSKLREKWGKISEIFREKTQLGGHALVKKRRWRSVGGTGKISATWRGNWGPPGTLNTLLRTGIRCVEWVQVDIPMCYFSTGVFFFLVLFFFFFFVQKGYFSKQLYSECVVFSQDSHFSEWLGYFISRPGKKKKKKQNGKLLVRKFWDLEGKNKEIHKPSHTGGKSALLEGNFAQLAGK